MTELSPEAKKLLRIAREEYSPADQRVNAVRSALELRIHLARGGGAGGAGGVGPAAAGALNIPRLLGLGLLAVTVAGVTVIGVHNLTQTSQTGAVPAEVKVAPQRPIAAAPPVARATPAIGNDAEANAGTDVAAAVVAQPSAARRTRTSTQPELQVAEPARREGAPGPRTAHARPAARSIARVDRAQTSAPVSLSAQDAPAHDSVTQAVAVADREAAPPAQEPSEVVDDSLAREIALLKRARAALERNDARAALQIADEHAAVFANGVMRQERIATRVLALCALHRSAEAIEAKHELERIAPRSPHLMRLRTSCAAETKAGEVK